MKFSEQLQATDLCVKCGLCLPHCPTYGLSQNEADSPRGRINLMQGLMQGIVHESSTARSHLESCLQCRACEAVCPSKVPFGQLMDTTRAELLSPPGAPRLAEQLLQRPMLKTGVALGGRGARALGLQRPLSRWPRLAPLKLMGVAPPKAQVDAQADVFLFTGCTASVFDGEALQAAKRVLEALGLRLSVPGRDLCCGALHQHAGRAAQAEQQQAEVQALLQGFKGAVLALNSGCGSTLSQYSRVTSPWAQRVVDLPTLLLQQELSALTWRTDPVRVAVHTPCTQRNVLKSHAATLDLLALLPGVSVIPLAENDRCCGAAGTHMLTHKQQAEALLSPKLEALADADADILVTANIGCALHFQQGLAKRHQELPVAHIASFIGSRLPAA